MVIKGLILLDRAFISMKERLSYCRRKCVFGNDLYAFPPQSKKTEHEGDKGSQGKVIMSP